MGSIDETSSENTSRELIEHFVFSGGGIKGILTTYALLRKKHLEGFWKFQNIKSVYGTSSGSIIGFLMILLMGVRRSQNVEKGSLTWQILDDYIIRRPWQQLFSRDKFLGFADAILKGGLLVKTTMVDIISPLLNAVDLDPNITLSEFYEWSKVDFHVYCVEMNTFTSTDLCHKNNPRLRVIDALWRSCSIPFLFVPDRNKKKRHTFFGDGSILEHYAIKNCIKENNCSPDSILGVKIIPSKITDSEITNMFSLLSTLVQHIFVVLNKRFEHVAIKHEFVIHCNHVSFKENYGLIHSEEMRRQLVLGHE